MTDLKPICAFGDTKPRSKTLGGYTLCENTDRALACLSLHASSSRPEPFGLPLPGPGEMTSVAFWMAPGQWMLEKSGAAETDFAAALRSEIPQACITEQTDGFVCLDIQSATSGDSVALLERLINLPPEATYPGRAVRTAIEHMTVFVLRRSETQISVLAMRSVAGSLWHALETAMSRLASSQ